MARSLNIRHALLAAVDGFIEASPASLAKAHRLIARCYNACGSFSIAEIVWGGFIDWLTDSLFYEDPLTLHKYRSLLAAGSHEIYRTYLNYDFALVFTPEERIWLSQLNDMLDFLGGFPFSDMDAALLEYKRRVEEIKQSMQQSPTPERLEDETIYHLILRDASTILINVNLRYSLLRSTHLVPRIPYNSYPPQPDEGHDDMPDITGDLDWARRALRSIVEQGWLLLTWQVTPKHYHLSLH